VLLLLAFVITLILLTIDCVKKGNGRNSSYKVLHVHNLGGVGHLIIAESVFCCGMYLGKVELCLHTWITKPTY
jgi:hypothetical protein